MAPVERPDQIRDQQRHTSSLNVTPSDPDALQALRDRLTPVVPAGGAGTRLWPLSRRERPKFLLDLLGSGRSLLQETLDRLTPIAGDRTIVVTGHHHAEQVRHQVGSSATVLAEPSPRNSMPAIALGAALAARRDPDAIVGSFAADHLIRDVPAFHRVLDRTLIAADGGALATIGITPTRPSTGFGYIEVPAGAEPVIAGDIPVLPVARFVEKPDAETAECFLAFGTFQWNAGMFVCRADVLLADLDDLIPGLARGARLIAEAIGTECEADTYAEQWPQMMSIAIDHALAEPLAARGRVVVIPGEFGWDDIGDFSSLGRQLRSLSRGRAVTPSDSDDNLDVVVIGDADVDAVASRATVYSDTGQRFALVGLDGVSVVHTDEVLLVLADAHAQKLSDLVKQLSDPSLR
ncbi:mannose-1-phosphate guanylyltransferase [Devriesea agamarum]|uniref:mannose-1-phosphate guanylyltransferase n=1 Tax=Devriesea agamarum TaxID=472569 RepID=UPI000A0647D1|nr:mannose-1-phosphate guanylyltransferase [Devriesea agamarum]